MQYAPYHQNTKRTTPPSLNNLIMNFIEVEHFAGAVAVGADFLDAVS